MRQGATQLIVVVGGMLPLLLLQVVRTILLCKELCSAKSRQVGMNRVLKRHTHAPPIAR